MLISKTRDGGPLMSDCINLTADMYLCNILDSPPCSSHHFMRRLQVLRPQVACFGTRTTLASEELVTACMADGRGARFGSGLTVVQGGCTEPRSVLNPVTHPVPDLPRDSAWAWPAQSSWGQPKHMLV